MFKNRIEAAIDRIKMADEMSWKYYSAPLYIAISGGKDSSVIQQLAIESGVDCVFQHKLTTMDAPETVWFVKREFKRLEGLGYKTEIVRPATSIWKLIEQRKGMPPTRLRRYCCEALKEYPTLLPNGEHAFVVTGVRWSESPSRMKRGEYEVVARKKQEAVILMNDNSPERKLFETCSVKGCRVCNPIIDWDDGAVWDYLSTRNLPVNPLYAEGFKRVGCVGCPLAMQKEREVAFERWPKFKKCFIDAIERGLLKGVAEGRTYTWGGGAERFEHWLFPDDGRGKLSVVGFK